MSRWQDHVEVEVLHDGAWLEGWLDPDYWRQEDGVWIGYVRYTDRRGEYPENYLGHFRWPDEVRRVG